MRRAFKYSLLILLVALSAYVIAPYGDRCSGLAHVLGWLVLVAVYAIVFLVVSGVDLYQYVKFKRRFDFVPLMITGVGAVITWAFWKLEDKKPWTDEVFRGRVEVGDLRGAGLTLYANGTFDAFSAYVDWACTYTGRFEWKGDTLALLRDDLPTLTDSVFTINYRLVLSDSTLVPVENGFEPIRISNAQFQAEEGF